MQQRHAVRAARHTSFVNGCWRSLRYKPTGAPDDATSRPLRDATHAPPGNLPPSPLDDLVTKPREVIPTWQRAGERASAPTGPVSALECRELSSFPSFLSFAYYHYEVPLPDQ